jgi:hypothetical protein
MIRALFGGLQERLGRKVDSRERIVAFIPEYAAYMLNRFHVGDDGKVAYERIKGKKPSVLGIEFGEKVLYKVKAGQKMGKLEDRWKHGIFVGIRKRSNELWVSRPEGIIAVRSIRRIPLERRWGEDCVNWVQWAPWHKYKDDEGADGDVPEGVPVEEQVKGSGEKERVVFDGNSLRNIPISPLIIFIFVPGCPLDPIDTIFPPSSFKRDSPNRPHRNDPLRPRNP